MNVKAAWQAGYTGKEILVAVVDDGVRIDHPDLEPKIVSPHRLPNIGLLLLWSTIILHREKNEASASGCNIIRFLRSNIKI